VKLFAATLAVSVVAGLAPIEVPAAYVSCTAWTVCRGTSGADIIVGTDGPEYIIGRGGDDVVRAYGGNDTIEGNRGDDELWGGFGRNALRGGRGWDLLHATGDCKPDGFKGGRGSDVAWYRPGAGNSFSSIETKIPLQPC
jgi:Ca2+-binding RTX toxin-like protein